jgi:DeoR/GlpR family transcriptional regulator of sugar metabolism
VDHVFPNRVSMAMLKAERHRRIQQTIEVQGHATVAELARDLCVAEMTIRRDLHELEVHGLVQRVHGGALRPERSSLIELPVLERVRQQAGAKRRIAEAVARMVGGGETIFLGSGSTTRAVAEALTGRAGVTVVTNALTVASALSIAPAITVVVVGGFLRHSELSLIGHFAEAALPDITVSKVIMGIAGIHPQHGLTSEHLQEQMTDRAILGMSETVIIVADHTKFGQVAASRAAPVTAATMVVTDTGAPAEMVAAIQALGVQVLQV